MNHSRWGEGPNVEYQDRLDRMYAAEDRSRVMDEIELNFKGLLATQAMLDGVGEMVESLSGVSIAEYERQRRESRDARMDRAE